AGLAALLQEAEAARQKRAESTSKDSAVCAWNHSENIPTFYNWNNRPR
ncbi:MAG TPA: multiple cyclophane-containing RiPP AmcA, partial [Actinoplanes sp.]|nr:multiple cyclophane-containing RiPP AmcA [Actinoplanes sp.]